MNYEFQTYRDTFLFRRLKNFRLILKHSAQLLKVMLCVGEQEETDIMAAQRENFPVVSRNCR